MPLIRQKIEVYFNGKYQSKRKVRQGGFLSVHGLSGTGRKRQTGSAVHNMDASRGLNARNTEPGNSAVFADSTSVSSWAQDAVDWCRSNGIVNGRSDNHFAPKDASTRAELAAILRRYIERYSVNKNMLCHKTEHVFYV